MKYGQIKSLRQQFPTAWMCRQLGVSESGFYAWRQRKPSARQQVEARLAAEVKAAHERTRGTYGPRRLQSDLEDHGINIGLSRIRRLRHKQGLRCKQKRSFKATTDSRHTLPVAPNLLDRQFTVTAPGKVWVTDITYIPTGEGWLYLAGVKDLFNGEVVGYAMANRMTRQLVMRALFRAVSTQKPERGLLHHSDRGSQYCSHDYQNLLKQFGMQVSMSRKGNCWDNAPMESCWGSLKSELVHHRRYATRAEAIKEITEYIEIFYNRIRKQARLGYLSPAVFKQRYYALSRAA